MTRLFAVTDPHHTNNPAHTYRWDYLKDVLNWVSDPKISMCAFLGDAFDAKDQHPASLVNRFVDHWVEIAQIGKPIVFMVGNHDYIDRAVPFLRFMKHLPNVVYVERPQVVTFEGYRILAVPHGWAWDVDAAWRREYPLSEGFDLILAHQTFCGAKANGVTLDKGPSPGLISEQATRGATVLSGDIHQHQVLNNLVYVGSPHPVSFGEQGGHFVTYDFVERKVRVIRRSPIRRLVCSFVIRDDGSVLEDPAFETLVQGDHVQIRVRAPASALEHYGELRRELQQRCEARGLVIFEMTVETLQLEDHRSVETDLCEVRTDVQIFQDFCEANDLDVKVMNVGASYVGI